MTEKSLKEFAKEILDDGLIDENEVENIKKRIYADGIIDREEADFLFELNDNVSGNDNAPSWPTLFIEALTDHVLKDEVSPNVLDEDEAAYLIKKIKGDDKVDSTELELIVNIVSKAEKCPDSFNLFVLESVKEAVILDGVVDKEEVEMIKKVIYGSGGGGG